ncbi:hypothetical protein HZC08_00205 [Candidatus Micrarchaeota archaeon]|nr:hypothetical protein [Candidatus Micrarchaeota archaeon]
MVTPPAKIEKYPTERELMGRINDAYYERVRVDLANRGFGRDTRLDSEDPKSIGAQIEREHTAWSREFSSLWKGLSQDLNPKQKEQLAEEIIRLVKKTDFYYEPILDKLSKNKKPMNKEIEDRLEKNINGMERGKKKALVENLA